MVGEAERKMEDAGAGAKLAQESRKPAMREKRWKEGREGVLELAEHQEMLQRRPINRR
jgi:hypothetical protein